MAEKLIVIGAGMATGRALEHLFEGGGAFDVTLFNAEPRGNYNRIMLSPVLAGDKSFEEIITHDDAWYAEHGVTCRFGEKIASIDRAAKTVTAANGDVLSYDKLLLGTGSDPFMIPLPGHDLDGVIAYRDLEDTERMMAMSDASKVVVIGGGLLGLEAAAGMAARGACVTVVHIMGHLMERQLDEAAGYLLRKALIDKGITVRCQANSKEILGKDGHVRALMLDDGTELPCDLLVMAVGIRPNVALAKTAELAVGRGIHVDDQMVTSDEDILAVGECVEHDGALFGLVAPLYDQAKVVAATLMGDDAVFSQKELSTKLKVTGCDLFSAGDFADGEGREDIVFRDPGHGVYRRLVIKDDAVIGAVMYGDTADSNWFFGLIRDKTDISEMRETLIFGPAYQGGAPLDPLAAVAALPPEAAICGCNGICKSTIVEAIDGGATDLTHEDLRQMIKSQELTSMAAVWQGSAWKTVDGCHACRPALNYDLIADWPTGLGIKLEQAFWGSWTPHKVKLGVSDCPRNCAEATCKDIGIICVDSGFQVGIGGAAGMDLKEIEPLAQVVDDLETRKALVARLDLSQTIYQKDPWAEHAEQKAASYQPVATLALEAVE